MISRLYFDYMQYYCLRSLSVAHLTEILCPLDDQFLSDSFVKLGDCREDTLNRIQFQSVCAFHCILGLYPIDAVYLSLDRDLLREGGKAAAE